MSSPDACQDPSLQHRPAGTPEPARTRRAPVPVSHAHAAARHDWAFLRKRFSGLVSTGGTFSVGDIAIASQLVNFGHAGYSVDAKRWPKLADFARRAHARASFAPLIEEERAMFPPT
jgi:glutathione S-transferase